MNLLQGGMSVQDYSFEFTQLSKYAPTIVANPRARMNKFMMGVSSLVEKECLTTMLLDDMDISRLMVYAQQIEESKIRETRQEGRMPRLDDFSHQSPKKRCPTCGKQHGGKCLARTDGCLAFGNKVHNMRDFPNLK
ncbi:hypothetical protein EJD97_015464 [Solanum chilense]|uniref:Retrotransposon gag domain-containing protein n=1 Tax=Solanum chilense TaxID=4083 RepID=A0A6N2BBM1_SOLCI|nr:hypothetical protein EJD97_015464 [Solanum chilense]